MGGHQRHGRRGPLLPGLIGSETVDAPVATVLSAADPAPAGGELGQLGGVVHEVVRPVRHVLATAGQVQHSRTAQAISGQALAAGGMLAETSKDLLGDGAEAKPRRHAAQTTTAPDGQLSTVDKSAARADGAVAAAPDIARGGTVRDTAIPERSVPEAGPADRGDVRSPSEVEHGTGAPHGQLPLPLPLSPIAGSTSTVVAAHGGNDGCGATLSGNPARHESSVETCRPAAYRSVTETACQPGVTPD